MLIALDLESIGYSSLPQVRRLTLGYQSPVEGLLEPIEDTVSVRLGFEKIFATRRDNSFLSNYTLRAGVYIENDHDGKVAVDGYDTHFTLRFGVTLGRERRLRLDMGFEFGDEDKNYLVSLTY